MKFVLYLLKNNKMLIFLSAVLGVLSGFIGSALLYAVSQQVATQKESITYFFMLVGGSFLTGLFSQLFVIYVAQKITFSLRLKMIDQMLKLPLRNLEEVGRSRLIATFASDITTIAGTLLAFPSFFVNMAITVGCLTLLGILSAKVLVFLIAFIILSLILYLLPERRAIHYMTLNRQEWDHLIRHFSAINNGAKELKLHYERRSSFYNDVIRESVDKMRKSGVAQRVIYAVIGQWSSTLYFVFMGVLLFVLPRYWADLTLEAMTGYVMISLYLGPAVAALVQIRPTLKAADVAFAKIQEIGLSMLGDYHEQPFADAPAILAEIENKPTPRTIELKGITHTFYREKEEKAFTLGPIDLKVNAGELIFIIGGNGSGKTTLAKLLTGLYMPESGHILLNGEPVTEENAEIYRQNFSAIFSDFFLFEQILGIKKDTLDEKAMHFLKELQIDHKVTITDGRLSTTKLSSGQRKRLALVTLYLENRPVYIFDEWAADQDPEFKVVFYRQLLPEFKSQGKTVFVISHDDRYFDVADRFVKLADGQAVEVSLPSA